MNKFWLIAAFLICICGCDVNPSERNNAGNALYDHGQYDGAIAAYQAAQVALPDGPEAYYNAASAYSQKGIFDKAIESLHQALKTSDSDLKTRAYYNLGNIYFQMYRFGDAVDMYQQALLLNPNDEDVRHNLELTVKRLIVPSPTPVLPTDQATDEGGSGVTPTLELSGQPTDAASASASSSDTSNPDASTPMAVTSGVPATLSLDDAESILDAVQQAQQSLPNQSLSGTPSAVNSNKDW